MLAYTIMQVGLYAAQLLSVKELFRAKSAVQHGHKVEVHMRSCFVQMNDGGNYILAPVAFGEEFRALKEERAYVVLVFAHKELRACAYYERTHKNGVVLNFALGRNVFDPLIDKGGVGVVRLYEVIVVRRALAVNLRVTLRAVSFVPFVFAFDADDSIALIFFHVTNYVCYKFSSSNFLSRILFSGDEKQNSAILGCCPRRRNLKMLSIV